MHDRDGVGILAGDADADILDHGLAVSVRGRDPGIGVA